MARAAGAGSVSGPKAASAPEPRLRLRRHRVTADAPADVARRAARLRALVEVGEDRMVPAAPRLGQL